MKNRHQKTSPSLKVISPFTPCHLPGRRVNSGIKLGIIVDPGTQ
jgi:hypothetical protein